MYSFESLVSIINFCSLMREKPDSSKASAVCYPMTCKTRGIQISQNERKLGKADDLSMMTKHQLKFGLDGIYEKFLEYVSQILEI